MPHHLPLPVVPAPGGNPSPARRLLCAERGDPGRARLERHVVRRFARQFGARVTHLLPVLIGLQDAEGRLLGVVGTTPGACAPDGPWFCEQYLAAPVEQALAVTLGRPVSRARLAEVGNLAAEHAGAGRLLLGSLAAWLDGVGCDWSVFTATRPLRLMFRRLGIPLVDLGVADPRQLGAAAADWGRYYDGDPRVVAADIADVRAACAAQLAPLAGHAWLDGAGWARGVRAA